MPAVGVKMWKHLANDNIPSTYKYDSISVELICCCYYMVSDTNFYVTCNKLIAAGGTVVAWVPF